MSLIKGIKKFFGMDPDQFKDHVFPELTRQQADRFRALLHKEFRQRGIEIELMQRIVSLEFPSGTRGTIDLENLYRTLSQDPERMEELVADFVPHVLSFPETESLTDAEFYSVLKIRLMAPPAQPLPKQDDWMEWPFSKDIVVQLVQDGEHTIASLNSDVALSHGDPADLIRIGERNTWQELVDADVDVEHFAPDHDSPGASIWAVESNSFFTGSAPLFLEKILQRWIPNLDQRAGVLFAVPHRHLLLAREVTQGTNLFEGVNFMSKIAYQQWESQAGPISPSLHLMYAGELTAISEFATDEEGKVIMGIRPTDYLMDMLNSDQQ